MDKLTKITGEKFIRTNNDAQVAQFGHLNGVIDALNVLNSQISSQTSTGTSGIVKILSGTLTHTQLQNSISNPISIYNITETKSFIPIGGVIQYTPTTFTPISLLFVYYNPPAILPTPSVLTATLSIDNLYWNSTPSNTKFNMQFTPAAGGLSQTSVFESEYTLNIGFQSDFISPFITPITYAIFGIELLS